MTALIKTTLAEFRIETIHDREKVLSILAENGYTVKTIKKERKGEFLRFDYFVVVLDSPLLPAYYPEPIAP